MNGQNEVWIRLTSVLYAVKIPRQERKLQLPLQV